jgi:hypothetical protein
MLTRKAAGEKRERVLTFTFKLAGCLNPARFAFPLAKAANFAATASHAIGRSRRHHRLAAQRSAAAMMPSQSAGSTAGLEVVFFSSVIPGWSEGPDPESRDSGFDARIAPE